MAYSRPLEERIDRYADELLAALADAESHGQAPPLLRRHLGTVLDECGTRATSSTLVRIGERLSRRGIYSEPPLSQSALRRDEWILFSTGPFPADSILFANERELARLVQSCLGKGVFRSLSPFIEQRRNVSREYVLPSKRRIDLLCEEKLPNRTRGLVAIELKRDRQRATADQMLEYLEELSTKFPGRPARGIIVTGREDRVGAGLLKRDGKFRIDWYCYRVEFELASKV